MNNERVVFLWLRCIVRVRDFYCMLNYKVRSTKGMELVIQLHAFIAYLTMYCIPLYCLLRVMIRIVPRIP